ncbi:hypothetical protein KFL_002270050 [Klebsormidium nitens]|uniref:Uncharacterized protein n=1 Tax=Klebsormidium nitens TaxID=105231 RepID=A0A1Y1I5P0_KLENI|nr:hypothetical protein KFL_002270050 [Klebsormidium nitens]|eukprot:GAQ85272.1 hypothetical protein KFL_002270050 [Klebsormidium nitens]
MAFANADSPSNTFLRQRLSLSPRKTLETRPGGNSRRRQRGSVAVSVLGGGGSDNDSGKQLGKVLGWATWGLVIWSALTGQLNWFFEGLTAITLAIFAIPVFLFLAFLAFLAYANSRQIQGPCPTCGADLSFVQMADNMVIVDSANPMPIQIPKNDDLSFDCPTCRASLKVENKKIVRGRPSFESGVDTSVFSQMFGRQNTQASGKSSGPIVDIEAEVRDKD